MKDTYKGLIFVGTYILLIVLLVNFTQAQECKINTPVNLQFTCTVANQIPSPSATYNISVYYPNGSVLLNNAQTTAQGQGSFNYTLTHPVSGTYTLKSFCYDSVGNYSSEDTYFCNPTGKEVQDVGQISTGIMYFYVLIGLGLLFLGYLFLSNRSLWVSYSGLFLMIVGFAFIYYDLHLANLYATTIATNSGAENVTTGAFMMFLRFIKLAPYLFAGVIAFSSIKMLKEAIKKKNSNDGWDNGNY
jgi:hypothetical protein